MYGFVSGLFCTIHSYVCFCQWSVLCHFDSCSFVTSEVWKGYASCFIFFPQYCFDWDDDSVVLVRDKHVLKYTRSSFVELLAKNEEGEIVWMDGRRAPYSNCWDGEYLNEERGACEYTIEEYQ